MDICNFFEIVLSSESLYELAGNIERLILLFKEVDSRKKQKTMSEFYHMLFVRTFFNNNGKEQVKIYSPRESVIEYFYNYWNFAPTFRENLNQLHIVADTIRTGLLSPKATGLSEETIRNLLDLVEHKFKYITNVLKEQPLKILQLNYSHIRHNCYYTATLLGNQITKDYVVMTCPHRLETHQEFGFVHELGHKLHTILTNKLFVAPASFECFNHIYNESDRINNTSMAENFADVFAIAALSNSQYEHCIPFEVESKNASLFILYILLTIMSMDENVVRSKDELYSILFKLESSDGLLKT